jgi:hypothetical protein
MAIVKNREPERERERVLETFGHPAATPLEKNVTLVVSLKR